MATSTFCELSDAGVIGVAGDDARAFLQAQITSDVTGLGALRTQYGGYCSPKGRLIATFLLWNLNDSVMLQLPRSITEDVRARLNRYVLRSKVTLTDASGAYALFGLFGAGAAATLERLVGSAPAEVHAVVQKQNIVATRLDAERFVILAPADQAGATREVLAALAREEAPAAWARLDIEHGIPTITRETQEQFVPQMVNLDLIGGVSYSKGCYPGQEIVARTHYLGRSKQRMQRVYSTAPHRLSAGDALYSTTFGPEQASGRILNAAPAASGYQALAVIQTAVIASGDIHWQSLDGPPLVLATLPYPIPD